MWLQTAAAEEEEDCFGVFAVSESTDTELDA